MPCAAPCARVQAGRLVCVRVLDLFDCGLRSAPEYLGEMASLEVLRLDYNQLREVPASLVRQFRGFFSSF